MRRYLSFQPRWALHLFCVISALTVTAYVLSFWHSLPKVFSVASNGAFYPGFEMGGGKYAVLSIIASCISFLVVWWLAGRRPIADYTNQGTLAAGKHESRHEAAILALLSFVVALYFATPPGISSSNFRMLWIDGLINLSPQISTLYFAPTLIKNMVIEYFGVEGSAVFSAICATLATVAYLDICRLLGMSPRLRIFAGISLVASGHMIAFYQPIEDFAFVTMAGLFVINAYVRRSAAAFTVAIVFYLLTRPTAYLLIVALFFAEVVVRQREYLNLARAERYRRALLDSRSLIFAGALSCILIAAFHLYWFYNGTHFLQVFSLLYEPEELHGFKPSAWSGVYALHAIWMFPAVVLACVLAGGTAAFGLSVSKRTGGELTEDDLRNVIILAAAVYWVSNIFQLEAFGNSMPKYNWRYGNYPYPFMILAAWIYVSTCSDRRMASAAAAATLTGVLVGSAHNIVAYAQQHPNKNVAAVYTQRHEIRKVLQQEKVLILREGCFWHPYNVMTSLSVKQQQLVSRDEAEASNASLLVTCDALSEVRGWKQAQRIGRMVFYRRG